MLVPFDQLSPSSRIWIYQANRPLNAEEQTRIGQAATAFFNQWQAHGQDLHCGFSIEHDQFLVLGLDEAFAAATGCSIDASVRLMKGIEQELGVNFFDRMQIPFLEEGKVQLRAMNSLPAAVSAGEVTPEAITFNNLVATKAEFDQQWKVTAATSWLSRYF